MERSKHHESKQGAGAPSTSSLNREKTLSWGRMAGQSPALPGDTVCNCWFVYRAGPAACEMLEVKGQVVAILPQQLSSCLGRCRFGGPGSLYNLQRTL